MAAEGCQVREVRESVGNIVDGQVGRICCVEILVTEAKVRIKMSYFCELYLI